MIQKLIKNHVNFAVVQYYNYLTKAKMMQNEEWEVIVPLSEVSKCKGIRLYKSTIRDYKTKSRVLSGAEITTFKRLLPEHFDCVIKNEDGAVYELKNKSFKTQILTSKITENE
jgi:hypothetical protein